MTFPVVLKNQNIEGTSTLIEDKRSVVVDGCHLGLVDWTKKQDSLSIGKCESVIVQNSVIRWATDECLGLYDIDRFVMRDSLIYESLNDAGHPGGGGPNRTNHGCGALYWTRRPDCQVKFERVLFAHHNYRALCNVVAQPTGSVVADFVNCSSVDCWNYYFQDEGHTTTDRNIRGCVFLQTSMPFKPSMWQTPGRLYIEDSWCIDWTGRTTPLQDQLDEATRAKLVDKPFEVEDMIVAQPAEGLLHRLVEGATRNITLDQHDVRVLGRIVSHDYKNRWTGVIDRKPTVAR
jgi:hypothetical protein